MGFEVAPWELLAVPVDWPVAAGGGAGESCAEVTTSPPSGMSDASNVTVRNRDPIATIPTSMPSFDTMHGYGKMLHGVVLA